MKKKISKYFLTGCGMMLCSLPISAAEAQTTTYSSGPLGLFISYTNTDLLVSSTLYVPDDITIGSMSLTLNIEHDWVGDLEIALTHPNGDFLLLTLTEADIFANWNIFALDEIYTFTDSAPDYLPLSDDPRVGDDYIIPHGDYLPITYPVSSFTNTFSGQSVQGEWLLEIWDRSEEYDGLLQSWQINLDAATGCLDEAIFAITYGLTSEDVAFNRACDFDKDNDIDGFDLAVLM